MHADRTNRFVISLVGVIALALGVGGLLAAGGVFGSTFAHKQLFANGFSRYVGDHGKWLWLAIAALTLVIVLLAVVWLLKLLFSTDRAGGIILATTPASKQSDDRAAGRTTMNTSALTQALTQEIETYHGVLSAKARVLGDPSDPSLAVEVTASRRAELAQLIERIEREAITRARQALERPELPVKLDIAVSDKALARATG